MRMTTFASSVDDCLLKLVSCFQFLIIFACKLSANNQLLVGTIVMSPYKWYQFPYHSGCDDINGGMSLEHSMHFSYRGQCQWKLNRSHANSIWGLYCRKQVSRVWVSNYLTHIMWNVITYASPKYLLVAYKFSWNHQKCYVVLSSVELKSNTRTGYGAS